jgi:CelD/BcsL family acetyltransferase involved in cellulose biosynthesis
MNIQRYHSFHDLPSIKSAWNQLLLQNSVNEIFLTYEWFHSWCQAFQSGYTSLILLGWIGEELVGIAPLLIKKVRNRRIRYRSLRFLAQGDYADFIVKLEAQKTFLRKIFEYLWQIREEWDVLELYNIPEYSRALQDIKDIPSELKLDLNIQKNIACPTMMVDKDLEFAQSCLKKKSMIRHYKYFKRDGDLSFQKIVDRSEIKKQLEPFFRQHIERRELAEGESLFLHPEVQDFYHRLVENLPSDWLDFSEVIFNGETIAYHFGFLYNQKYVWYKPAFNVQYAKRSPGEVLLRFLIENALEKRVKEFDFTIGDEPFKQRFSNLVRYNYKIELISNKWIRYWWKLLDCLRKLNPFKK